MRSYFLGLVGLLVTQTTIGHDFWLEAKPFLATADKKIAIVGFVGNHFSGESQLRFSDWFSRFDVLRPDGALSVKGEPGDDPMGFFSADKPGTYMVVYQTTPEKITIAAQTFNHYLQEEGLETALAYRKQQGLLLTEGKESYTRHAKTLVQVGDVSSSFVTKPVGLPFEIIPVQNPYTLKAPATLAVQVQGGQEVLLMAVPKQAPHAVQKIRTDKEGKAVLTLNKAGTWLLKVVKIERLNGAEVNWQSDWASLTFVLPE